MTRSQRIAFDLATTAEYAGCRRMLALFPPDLRTTPENMQARPFFILCDLMDRAEESALINFHDLEADTRF